MTTEQKNTDEKVQNAEPQRKPNETGGIYYSSFIKITDPDSGEVLLQTRGD